MQMLQLKQQHLPNLQLNQLLVVLLLGAVDNLRSCKILLIEETNLASQIRIKQQPLVVLLLSLLQKYQLIQPQVYQRPMCQKFHQ